MQIDLCDICGAVLGYKIFQLAMGEITNDMLNEKAQIKTLYEYNNYVLRHKDQIKSYEICENCKKIILEVIEKRKRQVKKTNKEFKDLIDAQQEKKEKEDK